MVAVLACVTSDQLGQPYRLQCMVGHTYVRPCVYRADKLKVECTSLCGARSCSPNIMFNMHHVLWSHSLREGCKMRSFCLYEHLSDQCMFLFYNLCTLVGNKTTAFRWRTAVCCVQRSWWWVFTPNWRRWMLTCKAVSITQILNVRQFLDTFKRFPLIGGKCCYSRKITHSCTMTSQVHFKLSLNQVEEQFSMQQIYQPTPLDPYHYLQISLQTCQTATLVLCSPCSTRLCCTH